MSSNHDLATHHLSHQTNVDDRKSFLKPASSLRGSPAVSTDPDVRTMSNRQSSDFKLPPLRSLAGFGDRTDSASAGNVLAPIDRLESRASSHVNLDDRPSSSSGPLPPSRYGSFAKSPSLSSMVHSATHEGYTQSSFSHDRTASVDGINEKHAPSSSSPSSWRSLAHQQPRSEPRPSSPSTFVHPFFDAGKKEKKAVADDRRELSNARRESHTMLHWDSGIASVSVYDGVPADLSLL